MRRFVRRTTCAAPRGAFALLALVAGCRAPTQIVVEVTTDVPCNEAKGTTITVGRFLETDSRDPVAETVQCKDGRVGSLVVVPSGERDDQVEIKVVLAENREVQTCRPPGYGPGCIVARRGLRFIPSESLSLPIKMARACSGVLCPQDQTCVRGVCVSSKVPDCSSRCDEEILLQEPDAGVDATPSPVDATIRDAPADAPVILDAPVDACPDPQTYATDPRNCGRCGHDCLGAACTAGRCDAIPIGTNQVEPSDVILAGGYLFWSNMAISYGAGAGSIMRAPLDGGAPTTWVSGETSPWALATDGTALYWTTRQNGAVKKRDLSGGAVITLASAQPRTQKLALTATHAYWANYDDGTIRRVPLGGGSVETVATGGVQPSAVDITSAGIYWANMGNGEVRLSPLTPGTGAGTLLSTGSAQPVRVQATQGYVFWTTLAGNEVLRAPLTGGQPTALASGQAGADGLFIDGTDLYFTARDANQVLRMGTNGGTPTVLVGNTPAPLNVIADARFVYFTASAQGTPNGYVAKVAR
jgi:hypothetical protein